MRVGFPGGPRLEWYDRNPQPQQWSWVSLGQAPHTPTQRWSYTVPTGKKLFLENAVVKMIRATAATALQYAYAHVLARNNYVVYAELYVNTPGATDAMNVGQSIIALAGSVITGYSADLSTGGTIDYQLAAHGIEFDA